MAVTSIWPIKSHLETVINYARNPEKTIEKNYEGMAALHKIDNVVEYAANDMKTEERKYVTCINCREDTAVEQFMETKRYWGKTDGRICFHGYQSFKEAEVTAEVAHEIGVKLAERLWGDRFEVVIATHCNTGHFHNHFVLNSVSCADGYHFDNSPYDYRCMREESDRLCREYRITVIENPAGRGKSYGEYLAEKNGKPTPRGTIRADIDRAIAASISWKGFQKEMEICGYAFKIFGESGVQLKYPGLKPPGAKSFFRFHKLGAGYGLEDIYERLSKKLSRSVPFPEEERDEVLRHRAKTQPQYHKHVTGLQGLYIRYCYELHVIEKHPASVKRVSFFMREDLARLDRLDAQTRFLGKSQIVTIEDLMAHKNKIAGKMDMLAAKRNELRNDLKRVSRKGDSADVKAVKAQIADTSAQLKTLRKDLVLCDDIALRSAQTREELEWLIDQNENERKEEKQYELFGRRSGAGRENDTRGN